MSKWAGGKDTTKKDGFLAFDLETAKITSDDAELLAQRPLGISCAVTVATGEEPMVWQGAEQMSRLQCQRLVQYLWRSHYMDGHTIVTYNGAGFDFDILAEESGMLETCKKLALTHVDMAFAFFCEKGFMVSLQSICNGMGLEGKSGSGAKVPRLWAEGKRQEVLDYARQDVRVTLAAFQAIRKVGEIRWISKSGNLHGWRPSSGRLLTVREAMALPLPDVSWMKKECVFCKERVPSLAIACPHCEREVFVGGPWSRDKFTGWLSV